MLRGRWLILALFLGIGLLLLGPPRVVRVTSQVARLSVAQILDMVIVDGKLQLAPWAGAQPTGRSAEDSLGSAFVPNPSGLGGYLNSAGGITQAANLPATCTVGETPIMLPDASVCACTVADTWTCNNPDVGPGGGDPGPNSVGPTELLALGTAGVCGDATAHCAATIDADGRVEAWEEILIAVPPPADNSITSSMLADTTVIQDTYGSATVVPVVTFNDKGQATGVVDTPIVGLVQTVAALAAEPCVADTVVALRTDERLYVCDNITQTWETAPETDAGLELAANLPGTCTTADTPLLLPDATLCLCASTNVWTCNEPEAGIGGDTPGANSVGPTQLQAVTGTPGTYGSATSTFSGTVDEDGRVSSASSIPIDGLIPVLAVAPEEPCVLDHVFILAGSTNQYICDAEGTYEVMGGTGGGTTITGIKTSTGGVESQHWVVTPLSGTQALGSGNGMIAVTVGTLGATLQLPDPTLIDTPTHITMFIVDEGTGYLTVLPFDTENIGLLGNLSPVPITGKGSKYEFTLMDSENWHLAVSAPILPGELGGETLCGGVAGSVDNAATDVGVNFDHSLTCLVPVAAQLKAGTVLQACSMFDLVTGAVAPQLRVGLKAGATVLATMGPGQPGTSLSPRSMVFCLLVILAADPTATTNTYTAPIGMMNALDNVADANTVQQPVVVDWSVDKTLTWYSNLDIEGTAPNTLTQMAAWTTIFKR